jgi:ubiquinone/menaquinone biosynthesis C-methylase UbiE
MTETSAQTRSPHFARNETAATYREIHLPRIFTPWARVLLQVIPCAPGESVLDVATGPGTVAREAAVVVGPNGKVVGVDISAAMLAVGRDWPAQSNAAAIEYFESSATQMPLQDGTFDVAYCQQGLQHMSDPAAALQEIKRLLKPGGRLGVALWRQSPFGLFRQAVSELGLQASGPQPSDFGRDASGLADALRAAGFEDVRVETRELEAVLEGGVPQALQVATSTSAAATINELSEEKRAAVREALTRIVQPLAREDGVHLSSSANIGSAVRR